MNDDIVVLPRKFYDTLLANASQKKFSTKIDKDMAESILEYQAGKVSGPFKTVKALKAHLEK